MSSTTLIIISVIIAIACLISIVVAYNKLEDYRKLRVSILLALVAAAAIGCVWTYGPRL